jgi:23S rRNA (guanosine2251-2'-O)-methyltransferase
MPGDRGPRRRVAPGGARRGGASRSSSSAGRRSADESVVAGRRAALEAVRSGIALEVLVARQARATSGIRDVVEAAAEVGVRVREVDRRDLDALAPDHRGVVARVRVPEPIGERDLAEWPFDDDAVVVVLDGIEDPQNLGAAARSAEAAGAAMLVTRTRRAADVTDSAIRASAGALFHLPHARVANIARALERLKDVGFTVVGLDERAPTSVYDGEAAEGRLAIVLGSEGEGMTRLVREGCDALVSLPMHGRVGSLNASASLAAVLYGWVLPSRRTPGA